MEGGTTPGGGRGGAAAHLARVRPTLMRRSSATKPMPRLPRCERTVEKKAMSFSRPCGVPEGRGRGGAVDLSPCGVHCCVFWQSTAAARVLDGLRARCFTRKQPAAAQLARAPKAVPMPCCLCVAGHQFLAPQAPAPLLGPPHTHTHTPGSRRWC